MWVRAAAKQVELKYSLMSSWKMASKNRRSGSRCDKGDVQYVRKSSTMWWIFVGRGSLSGAIAREQKEWKREGGADSLDVAASNSLADCLGGSVGGWTDKEQDG